MESPQQIKRLMTNLEIDFGSGDRRTVELDKRQPVSIGQHPSNDISIKDNDVDLMHCRIGWNKSGGYEVVSAGIDGVDLNGTLVQKAMLTPGDVLRIGSANVVFRDGESAPPETTDFKAAQPEQSVFSLKPLSSEVEIPFKAAGNDAAPLTADEVVADAPALTADEIIPDEADESDRHRRKKKRSRSKDRDSRSNRKRREGRSSLDSGDDEPSDNDADSADDADEPSDQPLPSGKGRHSGSEQESDDRKEPDRVPVTSPLRERFRPRPQRPGDRDPVRSPFVLSLGGGALALALLGATFYFILGRQTTQSRFDEAKALMDEGKYSQAVSAFEDFLALHPRDSLADEAEIQMWISRIERQASGASPNWSEALKELNGFISARRDSEDFEYLHDTIRKRAESIAEGAATAAGKSNDRNLLTVSNEAGHLLTIYTPQDTPPTDALKRIETAWRVSESAIFKQEAFTQALSKMDSALKQKQPMRALETRRELLVRYPDLANDPKINAKLSKTLQTERELVSRSDAGIDAVVEDHETPFPSSLSLMFHARSRTDEVSVGRTVFGIANDCCYALDSITGEPVWRRVIGWDTPFFPEPVTTDVPALLIFDTNQDELLLLDQQTGRLIWRQPEVAGVASAPLVEEGQAYVFSTPDSLNKVDLETGRLVSRLSFSQPVSTPAPLNDGARLVVHGDQEVLYTLTKRPLECAAVSYLGHKPHSIAAPLLPMGALLLVAENLPGERTLLHVLDSRNGDDKLTEVAQSSIPGHVVDPPVIRGRDLFVPSSGERVSSFSVSDEEGQQPLTAGPRYEAEGGERSPVFLATGPDRQVWMASRYLRKLRLTADAVDPGQQVVNLGTAAQPLQQLGKKIYVGRTLPYTSAITLFQADRDQLASQWQSVFGARLLEYGSFPNQQGLVAVSESGDVYRVSATRLEEGGFQTNTTVRLKLPDGLASPLAATRLADGRILVWCGDPEPQLWIINWLGQIERTHALPGVLQAAPVLVGSRIALPLAGRVHLLPQSANSLRVQDFALPQGDANPPAWRQLIALDEESLVAVTQSGQLRLLRLHDSPEPYLAEAGLLDVERKIDFDLAHHEGTIALATGQKLQLIDGAALDPVAEATLEGTVSNDVWFSGNLLFVETDRTSVHCFETEPELGRLWSVTLPHVSLSAAPYVGDGQAAIIALQDGTLLQVNARSGEEIDRKHIGQSLASGPRRIDSALIVSTADGSLIQIGSILGRQ